MVLEPRDLLKIDPDTISSRMEPVAPLGMVWSPSYEGFCVFRISEIILVILKRGGYTPPPVSPFEISFSFQVVETGGSHTPILIFVFIEI